MIVPAPAKINLTLEVTGIESNGYHTLDTLFCWLHLEDDLHLEVAEQTSLVIDSEGVSTELVTSDDSNLVLKAHAAMSREVGLELPTRFRLTKRIPAGGGLGGGSADAAACLVGLNTLFGLGLHQQQLSDIARPLGADVSFGLVGGLARGTRYGDLLEPIEFPSALRDLPVVLVLPGFPCPTPQVYKIWDRYPSRVAQGHSELFLKARTADEFFHLIANDLEEPALRLHPGLAHLKQAMWDAGLKGVCVSGSGSTLFGFLPAEGEFASVRQALVMHDVSVVMTRLREERRFEHVS